MGMLVFISSAESGIDGCLLGRTVWSLQPEYDEACEVTYVEPGLEILSEE